MADGKQKSGEEFALELAREGLKPQVEAWEDGFRTRKQPEAFEWWYFDFQLEDGTTVMVCFTTKGKGVGKPVLTPNATTIIKNPDSGKQKITLDYSAKEFEAGECACDVRMGPNTLKGDLDHYEIHTEGDGTAVDLAFDRKAPSWRPGTGKLLRQGAQEVHGLGHPRSLWRGPMLDNPRW